MSNSRSDNTTQADESDIEELFAGIDPLPEPPAQARAHAYTELQQEWSEMVRARKTGRQRRWLSVAATIVFAVALGWVAMPDRTQSWTTTVAAGEVRQHDLQVTGQLQLTNDDELLAASDARLTLANGADLRMREHAQIRWHSPERFTLITGMVYVDTADQADVVIDTPFGSIADIGTRFMVAVTADEVKVAVREGAAKLESQQAEYTAAARPGRSALLTVDAVSVQQSDEPSHHPRWGWIHNVTPGYQQSLVTDVLRSIGRDLGKQVEFASHGVEAAIAHHRVEGNLDGVTPRNALDLVTASANLVWQEDEETIRIDFHQ